ncbi:PDDEXK-like family protein [Labilibaculum antarcticum]|uniref:PD-(D/E)XK nuclease superfamily protein n=1 Tax=Labilibaculum antarcticum TaxID=1717717 RepID=A0A1Y1CSY6_9BACT|nr:PD-(D/E)XK nuclease family protein [Labilibaculum antarcticum]BAX82361.1 hypothetical protein ALGA_4070 [Labilibaculum antarcticum]
METLFKQVEVITSKYEKVDLVSGTKFNLFKILDITSDEVRLHTRLISDLLDPRGSHGQGSLFLSHFIKILKIEAFDHESATVYPEMSIGETTETTGGRIDIFIKDALNNSITIENKIYARDQENQLVRYYNHSPQNLFYLNLLGTDPTDKSKGKLKKDKDFKIISYRNQIICWLEICRKEAVELPLLREGISHYVNLLKTLVGQSRNKTMENEVRDLIVSSKENLKTTVKLNQTLTAAKIKLQWLFWKELMNKFESLEQYSICDNSKKVDWQKVRGYYEKSKNRDIYYGLWLKIFEKDDITIYYGIEIEKDIYYGFTIERNGDEGISELEEFAAYRDVIKEINSDYESTPYWLGFKYPEVRLNFKDFNSEAIFNLCDKQVLSENVDSIVNESINDIQSFLKRLEQI